MSISMLPCGWFAAFRRSCVGVLDRLGSQRRAGVAASFICPAHGIRTRFAPATGIAACGNSERATALFRITQEALSNIPPAIPGPARSQHTCIVIPGKSS